MVVVDRHGPEFGLETRSFESVIDVLDRANRTSCLVDKSDTINKHLTGKFMFPSSDFSSSLSLGSWGSSTLKEEVRSKAECRP